MAKYYSQLGLVERTRSVAPRVRFLDVIINGRALTDMDEIADLDCVSRFNFTDIDDARACVSQLELVDAAGDGQSLLLYVCPLCGDIGCGAVQIQVSRSDYEFDWSDFSYVNGIDDPKPLAIGPFKFEADAYLRVMREALDQLGRLESPFLPERRN
jgi:hypothetical protein